MHQRVISLIVYLGGLLEMRNPSAFFFLPYHNVCQCTRADTEHPALSGYIQVTVTWTRHKENILPHSFFKSKNSYLLFLSVVSRGPRPYRQLIFDVVISCVQQQPNWGTSLPPGPFLQHVGVHQASIQTHAWRKFV